MKKILLPSIFLLASTFVNAQTCAPGVYPTGIFDDFSSTTEPVGEKGTLHFNAETGIAPGNGEPDCTDFSATASRTEAPGKLSVVLTQPYGCYTTFGFNFGKTAGRKNTIDLTSFKTFSFDFTHDAADTSANIEIQLSIRDSSGKVINTSAVGGGDPGGCQNSYRYLFTSAAVAPGASKTISGTFHGGYNADYTQGTPGTVPPQPCALTQELDFKIVSDVVFTVLNKNVNAADKSRSFGLGNGTKPVLTIDNLIMGSCMSLGINDGSIANELTIFPNPTTGFVTVNLANPNAGLSNISIVNVLGQEVYSQNVSNDKVTVDLSHLDKGIYLVRLQSKQGITTKSLILN